MGVFAMPVKKLAIAVFAAVLLAPVYLSAQSIQGSELKAGFGKAGAVRQPASVTHRVGVPKSNSEGSCQNFQAGSIATGEPGWCFDQSGYGEMWIYHRFGDIWTNEIFDIPYGKTLSEVYLVTASIYTANAGNLELDASVAVQHFGLGSARVNLQEWAKRTQDITVVLQVKGRV